LSQLTSAIQAVFVVVAMIILVPAGLGLLNTLTINVLERTREIGMLRAVGSSRTQIRRIVTAEALLLGLFGASIGVLAGVAMSYGFLFAIAGATGWTLHYAFPVLGIISAVVLAVLLALFASILPARNAARLNIIRALQYE
jgi:putative ABC transport system permease protein